MAKKSKSKIKIGKDGIYDARQLGTGKMVVLGFQHMFAMFGATVTVPLLTGLSISTTLLFAGLGTLLFHLLTKFKVPAFLGSSFAFIGGYLAVAPMVKDASGKMVGNKELYRMRASALHVQVSCIWLLPPSLKSLALTRL